MSRPHLRLVVWPYLLALLTALFLAGVFIFGQWEPGLLSTISELLEPILAIVAVVSAVATVTRIGVRRNRLSIVWFSFMLGVILWFLSATIWAIYPLILGVPVSFPSPADVFELAGYVPILMGIGLQAWPFREAFRTKKMMTAIIMIFTGGLLALTALSKVAVPGGMGLWAVVLLYVYPVLDIVTLMIAAPVLLVFLRGTFWKPFLFMTLGIVLALSGDLLFPWAVSTGTYYSGNPLELLYDLGFLAAALGFYLMRKKVEQRSL